MGKITFFRIYCTCKQLFWTCAKFVRNSTLVLEFLSMSSFSRGKKGKKERKEEYISDLYTLEIVGMFKIIFLVTHKFSQKHPYLFLNENIKKL